MKKKLFENVGGNQFRVRERLDYNSDFSINLRGKLKDIFEKHKNDQAIPHTIFDDLIRNDLPSFDSNDEREVQEIEDDMAGSYGFVYDAASDSYVRDTTL